MHFIDLKCVKRLHQPITQVFKKEVIFLNNFQLRWQSENTDTL